MEHRRPTGWTGRPGLQSVSAHGASATLRVTALVSSPAVLSSSHLATSSKIPPSTTLSGSAIRDSFRTFLPGSAQKVESDVTYSKQTTAPFLPGAPTARCRLAAQPTNRRLNPIFRSLRMPLIALIEGYKL
jgi:hypothetical protein